MQPPIPTDGRLYTRRFFTLLGALFAYMTAYSLLMHLAKYVARTGGDIATVSWVFGIGMTGSLVTRPFVGRWIDRIGCKPVLIASTLGASATILSFQWFHRAEAIGALRVLLQLTQAAFLATIAVFAARIAPPRRSAESLAMIGMGGLGGMMIGPILGDVIFSGGATDRSFVLFFTLGAVLMLGGTIMAAITPGPATLPRLQTADSLWRIIIRHWPGPIVAMGFCMAFVQTIPIMFIERFVHARGLAGVTFFFIAYAPTAIVLRIVLRRLPERIGRRRTLILGLSCYALSLLLLIPTHTNLGLLWPAIVMGAGHCFSYPFLVDLAAEKMPLEHRGVATSVILGVVDIGFLIGFIGEGQLIKHCGFNFTLSAVAAVSAALILYYAWTQRQAVLGLRPSRSDDGLSNSPP